MATPAARTLQIFLPSGEPRGIRIAELTTRIVQAVALPRSELSAAKARPELDRMAVYFLFGEGDDEAKPLAYIGQTEDGRRRLDHHNNTKDFWQIAIVIVSRTDSFTQAHIRFLEWYCLTKAKEVGRFRIENDQTPSRPAISEWMEADLLDNFETISMLTASLGFPLFEPFEKGDPSKRFYIRNQSSEATGNPTDEGFVVWEDSVARAELAPSATGSIGPVQRRLIEGGVLVKTDQGLRFAQSYLFPSPSAAAALVLGRKASGWVEWKNKKGETLHDVFRSEES